jgi:hypothetical protein
MVAIIPEKEVYVDLQDGKKVTVHWVVPLTNDDTFQIIQPDERTEGMSVVGFIETTYGITGVDNFYSGTEDKVRITNQKGNDVYVVTLNDGSYRNYIPELP